MTHEPHTISKPKTKKKATQKHRSTTNSLRNNISSNKATQPIAQKTTPPFSAFNLDRLNLKPILKIDMYERLGIDYTGDDRFNKAVLDLYHSIPGKVNINNFLSKDTSTSFVVKWIMNNYYSVKHPGAIQIIGKDEDYFIREYREIDCGDCGASIPVGYLPEIKKQDKKMYDALLFIFQTIFNKTQCSFMGMDDKYGYETYVEEMLTTDNFEDKEEFKEAKKSLKSYQSGQAKKYYDLLHYTPNHNVDKTPFTKIFQLNQWVNSIEKFFKEEGSYPVEMFDYNYYDPDNNEGFPLFYSQYIGFYWKQDYIFREFDELANQTVQQIGICGPSWNKMYTRQGVIGEISDSNWPGKFHDLMSEFNVNVLPKILEYYDIDKKDY